MSSFGFSAAGMGFVWSCVLFPSAHHCFKHHFWVYRSYSSFSFRCCEGFHLQMSWTCLRKIISVGWNLRLHREFLPLIQSCLCACPWDCSDLLGWFPAGTRNSCELRVCLWGLVPPAPNLNHTVMDIKYPDGPFCLCALEVPHPSLLGHKSAKKAFGKSLLLAAHPKRALSFLRCFFHLGASIS